MSGYQLIFDISVVPQHRRRWLAERIRNTLTTHPGLAKRSGKMAASAFCYIRRPSKLVAGYDIVYASVHEVGATIRPRRKKALWWKGARHPVRRVTIPARHPIRRSVLRHTQQFPGVTFVGAERI